MASKRAIGVMQQAAIDRLNAAFAALAARTGVAAPTIPIYHRDPEFLRGLQLEAFAGWVEALNAKLSDAPDVKVDTPDSEGRPSGLRRKGH